MTQVRILAGSQCLFSPSCNSANNNTIQTSEPKAGISTLYGFSSEGEMFLVGSYKWGSDSTYRVAAAITQFAGGSTKYFGTYHAEFPKPKRDPA